MRVPLLDLTVQLRELEDEVAAAVSGVLRGGQFIMGPQVAALEAELAAFTGVGHAIGVANGSDALHLALLAAGVGPGDEVICPAFTFFATAGAVARAGATPVFVDIDPVTYTLSVDDAAGRVGPRTRAIIPVHLYGHPAEMDGVMRLAAAHGLTVIEDTAQAIGAAVPDGRRVAAIGDFGTYSFFPSKNLGALGDGGMVVCADADLAAKVRLLRVHGAKPRYYHRVLGYNSRLDELQAAILRVKLKRLEGWTEARRAAAERYGRLFAEAGLGGGAPAPGGPVVLPVERPGFTHVYHQYTIRADRRDALQAHLEHGGVGTAVYYPLPLHLQPAFAELGYRAGDLPVTEAACAEVLSLPIFPELTGEQQEYVVEQVASFYAGGR
ncbi:MAG: Pleiotropic regulatory protein [Symbiobacteriaceae bacterium]|jgi:dTDP-4-amino-4,6-dideoxygalactose transaminase|nr:Pleiotropic regulatory protein [Symbiobacteriaceae bacterium]